MSRPENRLKPYFDYLEHQHQTKQPIQPEYQFHENQAADKRGFDVIIGFVTGFIIALLLVMLNDLGRADLWLIISIVSCTLVVFVFMRFQWSPPLR